jgi:hypothetical protein
VELFFFEAWRFCRVKKETGNATGRAIFNREAPGLTNDAMLHPPRLKIGNDGTGSSSLGEPEIDSAGAKGSATSSSTKCCWLDPGGSRS